MQGSYSTLTLGRYRAALIVLFTYLGISTITRLALLLSCWSEVATRWADLPLAFIMGVGFDLVAGLWLVLPLMLFLLIMRDRWMTGRFLRLLQHIVGGVFIYLVVYNCFVEWFFFSEFNARFNVVAVDYLIFPQEVFVNLWDTYPVWQVMLIALVLTVVIGQLVWRVYQRQSVIPTPPIQRWRIVTVYALLLAVGTITLSTSSAQRSENRVINEISLNGVFTFFAALRTSELDYDAHYASMDIHHSFATTRALLGRDGSTFVDRDDSLSIYRQITDSLTPRRLNVVIVLEESFGVRFVKSLEPDGPGVAPQFDSMARDGVLFTNLFATGNRTVRAMEAVLTGFPPIPGQSIVRRPNSKGVFSLPALLHGLGYSTSFIYGGYSYFDNMQEFTLANGFERVIDRTDFPKPTFATIWGVCDEDLFDNSLPVLDSLHQLGRPFFSLILTVSNHSPFQFPDGKVIAGETRHNREGAVQYADYALGKFMREVKTHAFFDSTLFVVLGDHGARVYGSQQIPMPSYRIPVLFYGPSIFPNGERRDQLASQLDIPSTIMGVLHQSYTSGFFGTDLFRARPEEARALLSHNYDVALMRHDSMVVLGLQYQIDEWHVNTATGEQTRLIPNSSDPMVNETIALFQSAYYCYRNRLLHPVPQR